MEQGAKLGRRWRAVLAGVLSLIFPGLGQAYNRQPIKAVMMACGGAALYIAFHMTSSLLLSFGGLTLGVTVGVAWALFVAGEASRTAWRGVDVLRRSTQPKLALWGAAAAVVLVPFLSLALNGPPSAQQVRFYRVPSLSMCPTICAGDRIATDAQAFQLKMPERGDLIMLKHPTMNELLIKRVIGVPGDTVQTGPDGEPLVNGKRIAVVTTCGHPESTSHLPVSMEYVATTVVPPGSYFVVGDNLSNSFDSRIPGFGLVALSQVRGRPLYLYWSHQISRIGCSVK